MKMILDKFKKHDTFFNSKESTFLAFVFYFILIVFAIIYFKERVIFLDSAFHFYYLTATEELQIQNFRFGAIITQIFPIIGTKIGLSLKANMILYSISFVFIQTIIYCIIRFFLKNDRLAWLHILSSFLTLYHSYFWPLTELFLGIHFLILFIAFINSDYSSLKEIGILLTPLFSLLILFCHPLMIFPSIYVSIYFQLLNHKNKKIYALYGITSFVIYIIRTKLSILPQYELDKINATKEAIISGFDILNSGFFKGIKPDFLITLIPFFLIWIYTSLLLTKNKRWVLFGLNFTFPLIYFYILVVGHKDGAPNFYIQAYYLPLIFFTLLPLLTLSFKEKILSKKVIFTSLGVLVILRFFSISLISNTFNEKWTFLDDIYNRMENEEIDKAYINSSQFPKHSFILDWGLCYEMILYSNLKYNNPKTVLLKNDKMNLGTNNLFITPWVLKILKNYTPYQSQVITKYSNKSER